jgi:hypothetical protein
VIKIIEIFLKNFDEQKVNDFYNKGTENEKVKWIHKLKNFLPEMTP